MDVDCSVTYCIYNKDNQCMAERIQIKERVTIAGFHPTCATCNEEQEADKKS